MKQIITKISLISNDDQIQHLNNPIFNCIEVGPNDEAAGSFLRIKLVTEAGEKLEPGEIALDWDDWDAIVDTVAQYREQWEWK